MLILFFALRRKQGKTVKREMNCPLECELLFPGCKNGDEKKLITAGNMTKTRVPRTRMDC